MKAFEALIDIDFLKPFYRVWCIGPDAVPVFCYPPTNHFLQASADYAVAVASCPDGSSVVLFKNTLPHRWYSKHGDGHKQGVADVQKGD